MSVAAECEAYIRECRGTTGDGEAEIVRICYCFTKTLERHRLHKDDGGENLIIQRINGDDFHHNAHYDAWRKESLDLKCRNLNQAELYSIIIFHDISVIYHMTILWPVLFMAMADKNILHETYFLGIRKHANRCL